jgi:glycosyltransferase involved in cell wall biosynthesis
MRFLLVSVTDSSPASRANLDALLQSVADQDRDVDFVLVMRGGGAPPPDPSARVRIRAVTQPLATGLSVARNAALRAAREEGILAAADVVAFPDDDCRLVDGLLERVQRRLDGGPAFVCGPYGPGAAAVDWTRFPRAEQAVTARLCMRALSSINVFFAADVVRTVGAFDERFGLGARYGASEDADYVLRAMRAGYRGLWTPDDVLVEHVYKAGRPSQYFLGNVAVLAKHARGEQGTRLLLARCFAYGAKLTVKRAISPREFGRAFPVAAEALRSRP